MCEIGADGVYLFPQQPITGAKHQGDATSVDNFRMLKCLGGRGASVPEETLRFGIAAVTCRHHSPQPRVEWGDVKAIDGRDTAVALLYGLPDCFGIFAQGAARPEAGDYDFHGPSVKSIRLQEEG